MDDWLNSCFESMLLLSEEINTYAKRTLKVILCHQGPVCFTASVLVEYCTSIRLANIVAITADEGISALNVASQRTQVPVEMMGCPPVWGFSGLLSFVDIGSTILTGDVHRPFARAVTLRGTSNLPKGRIKKELRVLSYLIENVEELQVEISERKVLVLF